MADREFLMLGLGAMIATVWLAGFYGSAGEVGIGTVAALILICLARMPEGQGER